MQPYQKPWYLIVIGLITSIIQGGIMPVFGFLIPKAFFSMMIFDKETMKSDTHYWVRYMAIVALLIYLNTFVYKFSFGKVTSMIILKMRK